MSKNKQMRVLMRTLHLIISVGLALFIYSPLHDNPLMLMLMQYVIFPSVTVTGLWMWLGPRINNSLRQPKY